MSGISLTSSMRNNLLSLQQTAKLQDLTQNRLATGLKVNSAIDNPSSYYTAQSLNNRADDLNVLLDAMSQGIQTLKAVNESLEAGTKFLEQAKSVANSALETISVPKPINQNTVDYTQFTRLSKDWYQNQVGADGAVVETALELKNAVDNGKKLIVVYGKIDLGNQTLELTEQKIVGTEYFADINKNALYRADNNQRFSEIIINKQTTIGSGIVLKDNAHLSDLKVNYAIKNAANDAAVMLKGENSSINNADVFAQSDSGQTSSIMVYQTQNALISGNINVSAGPRNNQFGIYTLVGRSRVENAKINITAGGYGFILSTKASSTISNSEFNINADSDLYLNSEVNGGNTIDILENVVVNSKNGHFFELHKSTVTNPVTGLTENKVNIAPGTKFYQTGSGWEFSAQTSLSTSTERKDISAETILGLGDVITQIQDDYNYTIEQTYKDGFNQILNQFDMLINDSWYKGVNLLKQQDLKVVFNESRTADLEIKGVNATTKGLGLEQADWNGKADIQNTLNQLDSAINQLRLFASEFGNYYQIVTTRENFTNSLINVLTEGADALTLADMNQESANMLALQTRQQLAVNSLSLASQASQSVLKLF